MSLFQAPTDTEGFFIPEPRIYVGELKSISEFTGGAYGPSLRWEWAVFEEDGSTVLFEGEPATVDELSSPKLSLKAKARKWMNAHLANLDREVAEGDDPDELAKAIIGQRVKLVYTIGEDKEGNDKIVLSKIMAA